MNPKRKQYGHVEIDDGEGPLFGIVVLFVMVFFGIGVCAALNWVAENVSISIEVKK